MKHFKSVVRVILSSICLLSAATVFAQTTYTQTNPAPCSLATYECNQIPLNAGASYNVQAEYGWSVESAFDLFTVDGNAVYAKITAITQPAPPLKAGNSGNFSFTWASGSVTGTTSGTIKVENVCHNRCWPQAWIESSTVTVN